MREKKLFDESAFYNMMHLRGNIHLFIFVFQENISFMACFVVTVFLNFILNRSELNKFFAEGKRNASQRMNSGMHFN